MLFKLSLSNIRKSLRDYAVYFFTLIIAVSVFYVFNAIGSQAVMMEVTQNRNDIIELIISMLSSVSVFVAGVLGLLIVYASRFLMKRRNKEFALYMLLGMEKGKISVILLLETLIIGIGSLGVGLIIGIVLSQLMSALVANLFEADMNAYRFSVSSEAIVKTILYFAVMYLVAMVFNSVIVTRMKLINLMQSGKRSEQIKLKNPILCVIVFLLAAAMLGYAYYQVGWESGKLDKNKIMIAIGLGGIATFLVFWSVSGMMLRIVMSMKNVYYRSLNSFTFRQISSKVNTMVFSMTIICLMLFFTICALSSAFSIRNSMNRNLQDYCRADFQINMTKVLGDGENVDFTYQNIEDVYADAGENLADGFGKTLHFATYGDPALTLEDSLGSRKDEIKAKFPFLLFTDKETIIKISDYNALCNFYGMDTMELGQDEYIMICNYASMRNVRDMAMAKGMPLTVFGHTLHSKYDKCQDGFIEIAAQATNIGFYIVSDEVIDEDFRSCDHFVGNYAADTEQQKLQAENDQRSRSRAVIGAWRQNHPDIELYCLVNTRYDIYDGAVGLGAMVTFLGLYIGLVFLIACGVILALKQLSESVDSIQRYDLLRKIGVEEHDISKSLFLQTGIFFLLPLLLAAIHSIFGMKFANHVMQLIGTQGISASIASTSLILLAIYGGYFLVTYYCSKGIIRKRI